MIASLIIFGITYFFVVTEKIDKAAAVVIGAGATIFLQLVPYEVALESIDLNVIFLLMGMMIVMHILSTTGVFEWMAIKIAQRSRGYAIRILIELMVVTAFVSAWLDNVTTVILMAPITILICEIIEVKPVPFLILQAIASNIGGTATLIGDPPNVIIGSATHLTFNDFLIHLAPIVVVLMAALLPIIILLFRSSIVAPMAARERLSHAHPERAILNPKRLRRGLIVFGLLITAFCLSHELGIEPGMVALVGALVMLVVCRMDMVECLEKVEWNTILFFIGLFMLIGALEHNGVFEVLGRWMANATRGEFALALIAVLWLSAIASAVLGSIPVTMAMIPIVISLVPELSQTVSGASEAEMQRVLVEEPLLWALALGACLGGNGSLIGAAANVVIAQLAQRNKYNVTFMGFTRYGLPVTIYTLIISTAYLYLRYTR